MQITLFLQDVEEEHVMYSKSNNMEFMPYDNANEVADELFDSLLSRYLVRLETSMRERERKREWFNFWFSSTIVLQFHKIIFKRGRSYIDSLDWIKKKKATINSKDDGDKCFQYATVIILNFEEIRKRPTQIFKHKVIYK